MIDSKGFDDLLKLVEVVGAFEQGFLLKDHGRHGASSAPEVQGVVVILVVDQQFGRLIVPGGHSDIVGLVWDEELS